MNDRDPPDGCRGILLGTALVAFVGAAWVALIVATVAIVVGALRC